MIRVYEDGERLEWQQIPDDIEPEDAGELPVIHLTYYPDELHYNSLLADPDTLI